MKFIFPIFILERSLEKSFISPVVNGIIAGFGTSVYQLAINSITHLEQMSKLDKKILEDVGLLSKLMENDLSELDISDENLPTDSKKNP